MGIKLESSKKKPFYTQSIIRIGYVDVKSEGAIL